MLHLLHVELSRCLDLCRKCLLSHERVGFALMSVSFARVVHCDRLPDVDGFLCTLASYDKCNVMTREMDLCGNVVCGSSARSTRSIVSIFSGTLRRYLGNVRLSLVKNVFSSSLLSSGSCSNLCSTQLVCEADMEHSFRSCS